MAVSLRTPSFREAEHLAAVLDVEFGHAFAGAEGTVTTIGTIGAAPAPDLNTILRGHLNAVLDADRANRIDRSPGQPLYCETAGGDLAAIRAARERALADLANLTPSSCTRLVADLRARRHRLPEEQRAALLMGLMETNLRAMEIVERHTLGAEPIVFAEPEAPPPVATQAAAPVAPPATAAPAAAPAKPLFSELEEPFFHDRRTVAGATHQMTGQERSTLRRFKEVRGDRPVDAYTRATSRRSSARCGRPPPTPPPQPRKMVKLELSGARLS